MSKHYYSFQFNDAFKPRKLRNWEIPKTYPLLPKKRKGRTFIIANDRGHIVPGIPRPDYIGAGPWGHFIYTWDMPKRITRELANVLRDPRPKQHPLELAKITQKDVLPEAQTSNTKEETQKDEAIVTSSTFDPCEGLPNKTKQIESICPIHGSS